MKITNEDMTFIKNVVKTAGIVDIDNIIIEDGLVRAIDDNQTVVMLQSENVPELPFEGLGLNRINIFLSRLALVDAEEGFAVDAAMDGGNVQKLTMKNNSAKVEYRAANPSTIRAPKSINDTPISRVQLTPESVLLLQKAANAMPQNNEVDVVTLVSDGAGVAFELTDASNDVFSNAFGKATPIAEGNDTKFAHRYPLKTVISLFKVCPDGFVEIGQKGIMKMPINGLDMYILPQV